jgi:hypothetical protein
VDLAWLYQPLIAFMVALTVLPCFAVLRRLGAGERVAAAGAFVAAVPALVVAYAYMGALKEMAVLVFLVLIIPLAADYRDHASAGVRAAVVPLAVAGAAGVAAIGLAVAAWLGLLVLVCATLALLAIRGGSTTRRLAGLQAAGLSAALAVLCLPTVTELAGSVSLAGTLSETNAALAADPGNLVQPLSLHQLFGVWLSGTHRIDPTAHFASTMLVIGVVVACLVVGIGWLTRRREWLLLGTVAGFAAVLGILTVRGTDWLDAKVLVLTSPIAVLVAVIGILGLADSGRRPDALVLGTALALGIFGSAALLYHDTNLAPTGRLDELHRIGDRFAGQGPAYVADFDEIALYFLRRSAPEEPGYAHRTQRTLTLRSGRFPTFGTTYDTDQIPWRRLREFRLLVLRLGPNASRPPSAYRLVFRGAYYEVWERRRPASVIEHYPSGAGRSPTAVPPCEDVRRLATRARGDHGELLAGLRTPALRLDPKLASSKPASWSPLPGRGILVDGGGSLRYDFTVARSGDYRLWLEGDLIRRTSATIDGMEVEAVEGSSGGDLNVAGGTKVFALSAGVHRLELSRGGGSLRPGDTPYGRLREIVLEPAEDAATRLHRRPADWRTLCGRAVDWIEIRRL